MDTGVEATQEQLPDARQAPSGVSFSLGYFSFTPGILPYALRASFAVRARSCVRVDKQKRSASGREAGRNAFAFSLRNAPKTMESTRTLNPSTTPSAVESRWDDEPGNGSVAAHTKSARERAISIQRFLP